MVRMVELKNFLSSTQRLLKLTLLSHCLKLNQRPLRKPPPMPSQRRFKLLTQRLLRPIPLSITTRSKPWSQSQLSQKPPPPRNPLPMPSQKRFRLLTLRSPRLIPLSTTTRRQLWWPSQLSQNPKKPPPRNPPLMPNQRRFKLLTLKLPRPTPLSTITRSKLWCLLRVSHSKNQKKLSPVSKISHTQDQSKFILLTLSSSLAISPHSTTRNEMRINNQKSKNYTEDLRELADSLLSSFLKLLLNFDI